MMKVSDVRSFLLSKLPELSGQMVYNGAINRNDEKSIGIFVAPESRSQNTMCVGGAEATVLAMLPVNILVRWTSDYEDFMEEANRIYKLLQWSQNIEMGNTKVSVIQLLDGNPVDLGRDDKNICECTIRVNIHYYL